MTKMIRVTLYREDDRLKGFCVSGHAGYGEEGEDIICSAVSALTVNCVNSIEALTGAAMFVTEEEDGGYLEMVLQDDQSEGAQLLLESLALGLTSIESTYGSGYIKVENGPCPEQDRDESGSEE